MAYTPYNPYMNMNQFYPQQPIPDQMNQMRNPYQQPMMNQQMQMNQQAQQMQQIPMQNSIPSSGISSVSRPVGNKEEAMAAQIPFDNSVSVFTDLSHGKIYTKSFNMNDGSSIFRTFVLEQDTSEKQSEPPKQDATVFATLEYTQSLGDEIDGLKSEIERLRTELDKMKRTEKAEKQTPSAPKKGVSKNANANDDE